MRHPAPIATSLALCLASLAPAQEDDYSRAVLALEPNHYYRLDDVDIGAPFVDAEGNPVLVPEAGGYRYDGEAIDTGAAPDKINGHFEGRFAPDFFEEPLAVAGFEFSGPFVCGLPDTNRAFFANNAGSVNLGPGEAFAADVMTVACWFLANGSDGGDRIFTNNRPTRDDHFQITLGGSANLVIGIDPRTETVLDALQVPDSSRPTKDGQWHHIVASRNGPTMANVRVVIDGIDYTSALVDSTTGWGRTGDDAHIASRPGGDGGPNRQTLNGMVDEVAVWLDRELTLAEATDLYYAGLGCLPPATVTRVPAKDPHRLGELIDVALDVKADQPNTSVSITEVLPPRVTVAEIFDGGVETDGVIQWDLTGVSQRTVRYRLDPGSCSGDLTYGPSTFAVGESRRTIAGPVVLRLETEDRDLGPWESIDLGTTGGSVEPVGDHDLFIDAAGAGVSGTADQCRFIYLPVQGDFEISLRVDCKNDLRFGAQVGLMVRDTTDPHAAMVFFALSSGSPLGGAAQVLRGVSRRDTNPGRNTATISLRNNTVEALPVYLRMRRAEGKITLERSDDGATYLEAGSRTIGPGGTEVSLRDEALVGIGATAGGPIKAQFLLRGVSGPPFNDDVELPVFRRGDADDNNNLELTDAIRILGFLFLGSPAPTCLNAADADDNGQIELTDAIRVLGYLFLGGPAPADPGPPPAACGSDPAAGADLGCTAYASCG